MIMVIEVAFLISMGISMRIKKHVKTRKAVQIVCASALLLINTIQMLTKILSGNGFYVTNVVLIVVWLLCIIQCTVSDN